MSEIKSITKDKGSEPFSDNGEDFSIISKKTGRLASAVYLLTDFLPNVEPLKWSIRKLSLRIITETISLKSVYTTEQKIRQLENVKINIEKVVSLLETAHMSGLISEMNFKVILSELTNLAKLEESYANFSLLRPKDEGYSFDKGILGSDHQTSEFDIKDTMSDKNVLYHKGHSTVKDKSSDALPPSEITRVNQAKDPVKKLRADRQVRILDIIRNKKDVNIKDIVVLIKDCSEKTIQRELVSMINSGVLKRVGKRRWSKYSLNL
jgi:hypothetical protein